MKAMSEGSIEGEEDGHCKKNAQGSSKKMSKTDFLHLLEEH